LLVIQNDLPVFLDFDDLFVEHSHRLILRDASGEFEAQLVLDLGSPCRAHEEEDEDEDHIHPSTIGAI
jgi:hypothetical protein